MKCSLSHSAPIVFPNGDVFFSTASIGLDKESINWRVPKGFEYAFRKISKSVNSTNCLDSGAIQSIARRLEKALGTVAYTVNWKLAVSYEYDAASAPVMPRIKTLYNQSDRLPDDSRKDALWRCFTSHKYAACVLENREIVAICFSNNRAITVETKPKYRRKGFGTACLKRITKGLITEGLHPGFGTGYDNLAARKTAEGAGFSLTEYMYWIEIPAERKNNLPAQIRLAIGIETDKD